MIKSVAFGALCVLTLAGCQEKSLEELRAEVAAREAAKAAEEAIQAAKTQERIQFKGPAGYTYAVIKICLEGIQYYYGDIGHSGVLTPVIGPHHLPRDCEK